MAVAGDKRRVSKAEKRQTAKKQKTTKAEEEEDVEETAEAEVPKKDKKAKEVEEAEDEDSEGEDGEEEDEEEDEAEDDGDEIPEDKVEAEGKAAAAKSKKGTKSDRISKAMAADDKPEGPPKGVIYLGHLPKGFYETQMRLFFAQFGTVTRLRISRSKKNAASKGYGWIEFKEEEVAKIVAQTMDKYMMFSKILKCQLVPTDKVHPQLFKGCGRKMVNRSMERRIKHAATVNDRPNVDVDGEQLPQLTEKQLKRRKNSDAKLKGLLSTLDVAYDVPGATNEGAAPAEKTAASSAAEPEGKKKKKKSVA